MENDYGASKLIEQISQILVAHLNEAPDEKVPAYIGAQLASLLFLGAQGSLGAGLPFEKYLLLCEASYAKAEGTEEVLDLIEERLKEIEQGSDTNNSGSTKN